MRFRQSKKQKVTADDAVLSGAAKPERISNKLDRVLVAESKTSRLVRAKKVATSRVFVGALVVVLLAIAGYFLFWPEPAAPSEPTVITSEGVVLRKLSEEDLAKEIDNLVLQKKFKSAEELINYQDNPNTKNVKMTLASVYINSRKHEDAIRILLDIEKSFGEDWQVAKLIGEQYLQTGNKQNALEYFNKALSLLDKAGDVPLKQDEIAFIKSYIKIAQGVNSTRGIER